MKIIKHGWVSIDMESHKVTPTGYCVDAEGGTIQEFQLRILRAARDILDIEIRLEEKALKGVSR